ncbi:MAG: adenosine kinase [Alphaproteobacteria bacterium]|nr:adenosine kinase [Alphaproteobacteria bacterium]
MLDILAVGDAIVDKIISFDETDKVMRKILSVKGLFFIATDAEHAYLRDKPTLSYYAGGSAANTIRSMALMGQKTGFVGMAGLDEDGAFFEKSLLDYGVASYLKKTHRNKTGCSVVMVHNDKDRTQCAKACASDLLQIHDVKDAYLSNTYSVLTEGYMLNRRPDLVADIIRRADKQGVKNYFTLSDVHCVKNRQELILELLPQIDILFGNEFEFNALNISLGDLDKTLCVKTCGGQGVHVFSKQGENFYPLMPLDIFVNTNGAGDGFAAGFLTAFHQNKEIKECVDYGHRIACGVLKTDLSYLPKDFK